ncbi:iron uptake system protein EfeO [Streptomyces sp. NPDC020983]|uniref:iron uptake system protein EfeO n=1 Tax=Streptomyces sp. NPDC020983 TaxID=3365106 RepID=UPI0037ACC4E5
MPMSTTTPRVLRATGLLAIAGLVATGCAKSKDDSAPKGSSKVTVTLTDDSCAPSPASVPAGPVTFQVKNVSASKVTEAELLSGDTIIGEKENLTPGLSGSFSLTLKSGTYQMYCPSAKTEKTAFTVTGSAAAPSQDPAVTALLKQATTGYQAYVVAEVDKLLPATKTFTDAVRAGDVEKAKASFAQARYHYEEIEPVAESFGDLDPDLDAREDDVTDPSKWTGFHRLEKALWKDRSLAGMKPVADKLDADVARLRTLVATTTYQPAQLANGATGLLDEVAASKVTGEEDRYSHTDLSDFEANVIGAQKAFELLKPAVDKIDASLSSSIGTQFAAVLAALEPYRKGSGFVDYSTVGDDKRRVLTQKVDALAEPLSQVAGKVNG